MVAITLRFSEFPCPTCGAPAMTVAHGPALGGNAYNGANFRYGVLRMRLSPGGDFTSEACGHTWKIDLRDAPDTLQNPEVKL